MRNDLSLNNSEPLPDMFIDRLNFKQKIVLILKTALGMKKLESKGAVRMPIQGNHRCRIAEHVQSRFQMAWLG